MTSGNLAAGELRWLPDEPTFSLVSRYHVCTVHRLARDSSLDLFGHPTAGTRHDFTGQLAVLSERTGGELGDGRTIALERTLLRFYLPFRTAVFADSAVNALQGPDLSKLKAQLGLLSSRLRANHPLKACFACMVQDRREKGVAYWHLSHQCPGVWYCVRHCQPLAQFRLKTNGVERFLLHLPDRNALTVWPVLTAKPTAEVGLPLARIAFAVLGEKPPLRVSRDQFATAYAHALEVKYGVGAVRAPTCRACIADLRRPLESLMGIPEFQAVPSSDAGITALLRRLLRPRSNIHPTWHLLMTHWLFGDWDGLKRAIASSSTPMPKRPDAHPVEIDQRGSSSERALALHDSGKSVRAIALALGVDHKTASVWLAEAGVSTMRRPKVLKTERRLCAIAALQNGAEKRKVAAEAHVSIESITQLLRSEPGLHAQWCAATHRARQSRARAAWTAALTRVADGTVTAARSLAAADYAWLYRNDRDWLAERCVAAPRVPRSRYVAQWAQRDEEVCFEVLLAIHQIQGQKGARARAAALLQMSPQLERFKGRLNRMPLTRDIVTAFTRR